LQQQLKSLPEPKKRGRKPKPSTNESKIDKGGRPPLVRNALVDWLVERLINFGGSIFGGRTLFFGVRNMNFGGSKLNFGGSKLNFGGSKLNFGGSKLNFGGRKYQN
jgi:hypothetical protein